MKDKITMLIIGVIGPHVEKIFIDHAWWNDWVKPSLQSLVGAIIGLVVLHYGKQILHAFDNWRNIQKLNRKR